MKFKSHSIYPGIIIVTILAVFPFNSAQASFCDRILNRIKGFAFFHASQNQNPGMIIENPKSIITNLPQDFINQFIWRAAYIAFPANMVEKEKKIWGFSGEPKAGPSGIRLFTSGQFDNESTIIFNFWITPEALPGDSDQAKMASLAQLTEKSLDTISIKLVAGQGATSEYHFQDEARGVLGFIHRLGIKHLGTMVDNSKYESTTFQVTLRTSRNFSESLIFISSFMNNLGSMP